MGLIKLLFVMIVGYLLGSLSSSHFLAERKQRDLKEEGTGNLGATNTMLVLGKKYGILVMTFDVLKAYVSVKIAQLLLPGSVVAGVIAGCCSVVGHIFPFYLNFKGGKGVATLAGMFLAIDPISVPILLIVGFTFSFLTNYGFAAPVSASLIAPFFIGYRLNDTGVFFFLMMAGILVSVKHLNNIERMRDGKEIKFKEFLRGDSDDDELVQGEQEYEKEYY